MISEKAKDRVRILAFWERHGTDATTEAFGISKRTLYRWQKVLNDSLGKLESLNSKSTAPKKRRSRSVHPLVSKQIIELRTHYPRLGKDKLHALLVEEGYAGSVSTIGRILNDLKKQGLLPDPKPLSFYAKGGIHRQKAKLYKKKLRRPQSVRVLELDTIVRFIDGTKRYILTAIDTETRSAFACVYTNHGSLSAADFLRRCTEVLPNCPSHIQTDNGSEFAKYFNQTANSLGLTHYHTYPRTPKMNAHIERFNRTLSEEWIIYHRSHLRDDVSRANQLLIDYLLWYNTKRPHSALGLKSPFRVIVDRLKVEK
jgi:transposase InsO family protein